MIFSLAIFGLLFSIRMLILIILGLIQRFNYPMGRKPATPGYEARSA